MQLNPTARSDRAFTATEAMIVMVMLMVLAVLAMMWVKDQQAKSEKAARIRCVGNLKNLGLAFKVFANDNDDKFPFATTNVLAGGNDHTLWLHFQAMSNECGSAKILVCPADRERYDNIKSDFSAGPDGLASVGNAAVGFAAGLDASESNPNSILLLDRNLDRLRWVDQINKGRIVTLASNRGALERNIANADLVIGAVLVAGGRAPVVVTDDMVRSMKRGAVIVDVAVDQGGCIETCRPTSHDDPTYQVHGVVHYCVPNIPSGFARTASQAISNVIMPLLLEAGEEGGADDQGAPGQRADVLRSSHHQRGE